MTPGKFLVRPEAAQDSESIAHVHKAAFPTALEAELVAALRSSGRLSVSLVAVIENGVVGHIAFSPVTVADKAEGLGLAPLAVLPEYQRRGIGLQLVTDGLAATRGAGAGFVVVLGGPGFYGRAGFEPAARWHLRDEYGGGDAFQALELVPGAIPRGGGLVRYSPEFAIFAG